MTGFAGGFTPIMKTGILNGLAVADCHTNFKSWNGPNMGALTAAHWFAVVIVDADNSDGALWELGALDSGDSRYPFTDGNIYEHAFSSVRYTVGNPAPSLTTWRVVEVSSIVNEWIYKIDGTQIGSTQNPNTVGGKTNPRLGCTASGTFPGQIAGMYLCSAKLSSPDRSDLITYINNRFGLSAS